MAAQRGPEEHNFKALNGAVLMDCVRQRRCMLCGEPVGYWITFVGGPNSVKTRTFPEPGMHLECAEYAAKICPFILSGGWDRTKAFDRIDWHGAPGGLSTKPGQFALYTTRRYSFYIVPVDRLHSQYRIIIKPAPAKFLTWIDTDRAVEIGQSPSP